MRAVHTRALVYICTIDYIVKLSELRLYQWIYENFLFLCVRSRVCVGVLSRTLSKITLFSCSSVVDALISFVSFHAEFAEYEKKKFMLNMNIECVLRCVGRKQCLCMEYSMLAWDSGQTDRFVQVFLVS